MNNARWRIIAVGGDGDEVLFAYTAGLLEAFGHPELIVFGLTSPQLAATVLNAVGDSIEAGGLHDLDHAEARILDGLRVGFRPMHPSFHELFMADAMERARIAGRALVTMQLFWPDKAGQLPYEARCDYEVRARQPIHTGPIAALDLQAHRKAIGLDDE